MTYNLGWREYLLIIVQPWIKLRPDFVRLFYKL